MMQSSGETTLLQFQKLLLTPRKEIFSHHLGSPEVVQVHDALELHVTIHNGERSDFLLFHDRESRDGKLAEGDSFRISGHTIASGKIKNIFAAVLKQTTQVAVTDDAHKPGTLHHGGDSELFSRHFINHVGHRRPGSYTRNRFADMHQRFHAGQTLAEFASGMEVGEVFFLETTLF